MKCPECGKEMKLKRTFVEIVDAWGEYDSDSEDWSDDYEYGEWIETHSCKDCKIKYHENEDRWEIPTQFLPSDKQVKCANWIINLLHTGKPAPTKKSLWLFIKENINAAKEVREQQIEDFYYDNHDWLEEPF